MHKYCLVLFCLITAPSFAQETLQDSLRLFSGKVQELQGQIHILDSIIEELKLNQVIRDINEMGIPATPEKERIITHSAMVLSYNEQHEQANWVMHVITSDIFDKRYSRSNDFREDPKVLTGSAEEIDYFVKTLNEDSTYTYDGYGYDRGHLAPSADFRWSQKALSESYYYSNMSPQRPEFNREAWGELESKIRGYLYSNPGKLFVVTGPVLTDDLPYIERSLNKVSIPAYYFKVVLDYSGELKRGIGFIMPNQEIKDPLETYAVTIDSVEALTGYDFFSLLPHSEAQAVESSFSVIPWLGDEGAGDFEPLSRLELPRGSVNTIQASTFKGSKRKLSVCGTVVSGIASGKGNVFLNLDKRFPDQVFTVLILKKNLINFSYIPNEDLYQKRVCVTGKILDFDGTPTMIIDQEKELAILGEGPH
jgi:endonuclease G